MFGLQERMSWVKLSILSSCISFPDMYTIFEINARLSYGRHSGQHCHWCSEFESSTKPGISSGVMLSWMLSVLPKTGLFFPFLLVFNHVFLPSRCAHTATSSLYGNLCKDQEKQQWTARLIVLQFMYGWRWWRLHFDESLDAFSHLSMCGPRHENGEWRGSSFPMHRSSLSWPLLCYAKQDL